MFRLLPGCDVFWHVLPRCTAGMIGAAPKLKLIQKIGVDMSKIDLGAAGQRSIPVCNIPGTNAELALDIMLSLP